MKVILKNNVKDKKGCIPKPHVHAFYISNFRGQIAIPRTQNGAQTLSNSSDPGRINKLNAPSMSSEGVDLSN